RRHTRFSRDWSSDVCSSDLQVLKTDSEGFYKTNVAYHIDYLVKATKDDYTGADAFSAKGESDRTHNFVLNSSKESLEANKDLARSEERRVGKECRSRAMQEK